MRTLNQNQCVFVRGFRIFVREGYFSRRWPEISSINLSTTEDLFGSKSNSAPFSPSTGATRTWFGFGGQSVTSHRMSRMWKAFSTLGKGEETQANPPDVILNPILTASEVVHSP